MNLWNKPPEILIETLRRENLHRAYIVTLEDSVTLEDGITSADGAVRASHPCVEPLAREIQAHGDYRAHEGCFFEVGEESGHLLSAFVHRTRRGQGAGGVRFWTYAKLGELVTDGLRLSQAMGQKSALAGLWWGGGKGVIARRPNVDHLDGDLRRRIFRDYGRFLTGLKGCYVAAEDVGTTPADIAWIHETTRHVTCIPPGIGGSGNPSRLTASGVVVAMEAVLAHLGRGDLSGKTLAMQGLGNVASFMIGDLLDRGVSRIIATDIDATRVEAVRDQYQGAPLELRHALPGDHGILATPCDILAPSAIGACLNPETIPTIQAPIICGAANNQLAQTRRDAEALKERGIVYIPDYLANRMGIVNCANEQYGVFEGDPAIRDHLERETSFGIFQRTLEVLRRADAASSTTAEEADRLADELADEPHPIWPDRGRRIIKHLVESNWEMR